SSSTLSSFHLMISASLCRSVSLFCNATPPTAIYTLSLHDALPISLVGGAREVVVEDAPDHVGLGVRLLRLDARHDGPRRRPDVRDRKSTRLNSSHGSISYAVFCLKKKKTNTTATHTNACIANDMSV